MPEVRYSDITGLSVGNSTATNTADAALVAKDILAKVKETNPTLTDDHLNLIWGVVLLRLAVRTTSEKSLGFEETTFKIGDVEYKIKDEDFVNVVDKHVKTRFEKNPLRHWARGSNAAYLDIARKTPNEIMSARALKCGLPKDVGYLCADFLVGSGLSDFERTCYLQAQNHMLAEKAGIPATGTLTTIANLGYYKA
ncbi:CP [Strawberry chlorotic fleck-associated virus]|uniref:CP n=1 Tax=Strawberry chlorotic fleck-associated virus TaxID=399314 RepID=Q0GK48_9CLOS|nr:CP [Strawberry chlorotic fleck-associated virus]ABI23188.1 CP [Strawberry chlorotic fleck-associated virus]QZN83660.1 CP [Strawberry chlorotic fleck-associated virus]